MKRAPGLLAQRLAALFVVGALLFNFPLLRLVLGDGGGAAPTTLGWPRPAWLLFGIWALLIVLLAVLMERGGNGDAG